LLAMRSAILRAVAFAATGSAVIVAVQLVWALLRPKPSSWSWLEVVFLQFGLGAASMGIFGLGALIGFVAVRNHVASVREAALLGAVGALPTVMLSSVLPAEIGAVAAIATAIGFTALVAIVGGGGLRSRESHG
jgi:hypothetical protein